MRVTFVYMDVISGVQYGNMALMLTRNTDLPIGLGCLRAFSAQDPEIAGRVEMTNRYYATKESEERIVEDLAATAPDLLAASCYIWNAEKVLSVCEKLKRRRPDVRIVVGGPEVPRDDIGLRSYLETHAAVDVAVAGEAEETFADILKASLKGAGLESVPGLACRTREGIAVTGTRAFLQDLSRIPSPYLTGQVVLDEDAKGFVMLETSRGCPVACSFCDYHLGRLDIRVFPLDRFRRELDYLRDRRFKGSILVIDPLLNLKKQRFKDILDLCRGWEHPVHFILHPEMFDDESIAKLGAIPKPVVSLGIQSVNPEAMRNINRGFHLDAITKNVAKLLKHKNVTVILELIIGLPGDDYESFKRTLDWSLSFRPLPHIQTFDLWIIKNAPLATMTTQMAITTDVRGMVTSSLGYSQEDMMRSSWLWSAYESIQDDAEKRRMFERIINNKKARPSDTVEKLAKKFVDSGRLPRERVRAI